MPGAVVRAIKVTALSVGGLFWLLMALGSLLIVWNSLTYIQWGTEHPFVLEKKPYSDGWFYLFMLWAHIASGCVVLLAALGQFSRRLLRRWPKVHKGMGLLYVWTMLAVLAPTGIYVAFFAKGGFSGMMGFLLLGVAGAWFTCSGWRALGRGNIPAHRDWMIRSYAMATSAVTFRAMHIGFFYLELPYEQNYLLSLWLSTLVNLLAAEALIGAFHLHINKKPNTQPERNPTHALLQA